MSWRCWSFFFWHTLIFLFFFLVSAPASSSNLQRCLAGVERQRAAEGGREPHGCQQTSGPVHLPASDETQAAAAAAEPEPPAGLTVPRPDRAEQEWRWRAWRILGEFGYTWYPGRGGRTRGQDWEKRREERRRIVWSIQRAFKTAKEVPTCSETAGKCSQWGDFRGDVILTASSLLGWARAASCFPTSASHPGSPAALPCGGSSWWDGKWEKYSDSTVSFRGAPHRRLWGKALQHRGDSAPQDFCHEPGLQSQPGARLWWWPRVKG